MVELKLKEWGNSIGAVVPSKILKEFGLKKGDVIEVDIVLKKKIDGFGFARGASPFVEEKESHNNFW